MENAGRGVAEEALKMVRGSRYGGRRIVVVCGTGNNGGDGLVAARHLINAGVRVKIFVVGKISKLKPDPKANYNILKQMGQKIISFEGAAAFNRRFPKNANLIIDAIFGIGLKSEVRSPIADVIDFLNRSKIPILAVDVPSGLDADTGKVLGTAIRAKKTVTFVADKKGFNKAGAKRYCGRIVVRDIGVLRIQARWRGRRLGGSYRNPRQGIRKSTGS
jgi:NAD(P)H-hydrate epimerase